MPGTVPRRCRHQHRVRDVINAVINEVIRRGLEYKVRRAPPDHSPLTQELAALEIWGSGYAPALL